MAAADQKLLSSGMQRDSGTLQEAARRLSEVEWYHGGINRHIAESLLFVSGKDGSYLLRDSMVNVGSLTLSVRCKDSVKHFPVEFDGGNILFGKGVFSTWGEFLQHFNEKPLIGGGDSGILTTLCHPYPRSVEEPSVYDRVSIHASIGLDPASDSDEHTSLHLGTKEGFLTKLGGFHKVWRRRWFVLYKNELKYYRQRHDEHPVKTLDLTTAQECCRDWTYGKDHGFRLAFPNRIYYIYASTEEEVNDWVEILQWKLSRTQPTSVRHFDKGTVPLSKWRTEVGWDQIRTTRGGEVTIPRQ